jgi:DNA mismatch endonuclease (patch repair protein)
VDRRTTTTPRILVPPRGDEPGRVRPSPELSHRMSQLARRNTQPELLVRRALHAAGLRYRVHLPVPGNARRTIDVAFTRLHIAVFIDGCFWHGCTIHGVEPRSNSEWWRWKLERNRTRDASTNDILTQAGWLVARYWEHQTMTEVTQDIIRKVKRS